MNLLLGLINAAACGLIAVVLMWMILSPKVHDGVIIKAGLIAMSLGFGSIALLMLDGMTADDIISLERSLLLVNAGVAVVIVGYLLRKASARHALRRSTDWSDLDTIPAERWAQVSGGKR